VLHDLLRSLPRPHSLRHLSQWTAPSRPPPMTAPPGPPKSSQVIRVIPAGNRRLVRATAALFGALGVAATAVDPARNFPMLIIAVAFVVLLLYTSERPAVVVTEEGLT